MTNPNKFELEGNLIMGSSGQNVQDIQRFSNLDDPIDIMEKILEWGHQIPSAPDTLRNLVLSFHLFSNVIS